MKIEYYLTNILTFYFQIFYIFILLCIDIEHQHQFNVSLLNKSSNYLQKNTLIFEL